MLNKHVYLKVEKVLGVVVEASLLKDEVTVRDTTGDYAYGDMVDAIELSPITQMKNDEYLYEGDIFEEKGRLFEVRRHETDLDNVYIVTLDKFLKPTMPASMIRSTVNKDKFAEELYVALNNQEVKFFGNTAYTEPAKSFDFSFDLKIVKRVVEGEQPEYYYAGNNKHDFEIDLIKVIYAGANIFPNEAYVRKTYSYDEFEYKMTEGALEEASTYELEQEARRKMFGDQRVAYNAVNDYHYEDDCDCDDEF